ncbi:MAG: type II secretion system F family protein [Planctomycetota bacterium]|nr:type II secretion system F family protein [Planctomycetota bacterium]
MPTFMYEAMDSQGNTVKDTIEAASEKEANDKIRAMNYYPTKVQSQGGGAASMATPQAVARKRGGLSLSFRVKPKELSEFTRQFATLLDAGLPVVRSLDILQNNLRPGMLKDVVGEVKEDVEGGSALSEALTKHPKAFDKLYVNMVKAGEAAGILDQILSRLADYLEKAQRLKQKIVGALTYPIAVITIAAGILSLIMIFIIPKFEAMFNDMGLDLPIMTKMLLGMANVVVNFWYLLLLVPFILYGVFVGVRRTPQGRYYLDMISLKFPIFGLIISKSSVSRFCRTLGTLIQSGVPILNALAIIKNATGNAVVATAIENVHNSIREGDTIAEPLRHSGVFDDLVVNMIQVGEETGELDKMLIKVADNYDNEVDTLVGSLMSLLEPILIIGMGGTVGFIVIALFMPMIKLMEGMSGG